MRYAHDRFYLFPLWRFHCRLSAFMERAARLELASGIPRRACGRGPSQEPCRPQLQLPRGAWRRGRQRVSPIKRKTGHPNRTSCSIWSGLRGSNSLPPPWQGGALPDELSPRNKEYSIRRMPPCQEKTNDFLKKIAHLILESIKTRELSCFYSANGALDSYETHRRAKRGGSH